MIFTLRFPLSRPHSPLPNFVSLLSFTSFGQHLLNPKVPLFSKGCSLCPPPLVEPLGERSADSTSVSLGGRSLLPSVTVSSEPGTCPRCSPPEISRAAPATFLAGVKAAGCGGGCPDGMRAARCQCWPGDPPGWGPLRAPSRPPARPPGRHPPAPPPPPLLRRRLRAEARREATREGGPGAPAGLAHGRGELGTGLISSGISPQAAARSKPRASSSLGWVSPVQLGHEGKGMSALVRDITGVIFWADVRFPLLFIVHLNRISVVFPRREQVQARFEADCLNSCSSSPGTNPASSLWKNSIFFQCYS